MPLKMRLEPMRAGKTSWLFQVLDINSRYTRCLYVNSTTDARSDGVFSSHNKFLRTPETSNVDYRKVARLGAISADEYARYRVICIDEANLYDDLRDVVVALLDTHDPEIYVAGLNGSFRRELFGQCHLLLPHVEPDHDVVCAWCAARGVKSRAVYSRRIGDDDTGSEVLIGYDNYATVCRRCYLTGTAPTPALPPATSEETATTTNTDADVAM